MAMIKKEKEGRSTEWRKLKHKEKTDWKKIRYKSNERQNKEIPRSVVPFGT